MNLQRQLSNGDWADCGDRTEEFLVRCEKNNTIINDNKIMPRHHGTRDLTRTEVLEILAENFTLTIGENWNSKCRDGKIHEARKPVLKPYPRDLELDGMDY